MNAAADDAQGLLRQLSQVGGITPGGGFDPFAMLSGQRRFHSVFLAPFAPSLEEAIARFLADGEGPLRSVVEQFRQQGGFDAATAATRVRELFAAAQGTCVVVEADDQGLVTVPQLFFGSLDAAFRSAAVETCAKRLPPADAESLAACLLGLERLHDQGLRWPRLCNGPQLGEDILRYWLDVGGLLVRGVDGGLFGAAPDRLADLGHWTARALGELAADGAAVGAEGQRLRARCHCLAGEIDAAAAAAAAYLASGEAEDEATAILIQHLVDASVARGRARAARRFFEDHAAALDEVLGGCYELELPRFKAHAAAMATGDELVAAADRLRRADRKAFRHDLNREPLWRVAVDEPGPLIDTHEAAERLDRSITFVAKRLEQGTLPSYRDGDELRIPVSALDAWWAVMERFELID